MSQRPLLSDVDIIALHGFLGEPEDWSTFERDLREELVTVPGNARVENFRALPAEAPHIHAPDLLLGADLDFKAWTKEFIGAVPLDMKPWLIGYSMGGRLALHAALAAPEKFAGAIFVSANPGLASEEEKVVRKVSDHFWAERFRKEPWPEVIDAWNAQPVLVASVAKSSEAVPLNRSKPQDQERVALSLETWSLGRQKDLREELSTLKLPHAFVTGDGDTKFTSLTRALRLSPSGIHHVIEGAGHRVPWDQPAAFARFVRGMILDTLR